MAKIIGIKLKKKIYIYIYIYNYFHYSYVFFPLPPLLHMGHPYLENEVQTLYSITAH